MIINTYCSVPSFFFINKIRIFGGELECQIKFLAKFSSIYSHKAANSVCDRLQIGPNGSCVLLAFNYTII